VPLGVAQRAGVLGVRLTYDRTLSNELSNNSSPLGVSGASATELEQAKCQVVVLLSGGLGTENRKDGGSTPPLATTSDQAKWPGLCNLRLFAVPQIVQFSGSDCLYDSVA